MALVEQVNSMKQNGMSDVQIMNSLKEQGFSPMEINEALSQSRIKAAVSQEEDSSGMQEETPGMEGMQSSMMNVESSPEYISTPNQKPEYQNQYAATPMPAEQAAAPEQQAYPQEQYYAQPPEQQAQYAEAGYYSQAVDLETVRDISKRAVEESLKKIREEISSLSKIKTELKFEIQDMQNRLAKIESSINNIQYSAIKKIDAYGDSIAALSKEIKATQDSFSKVINPLVNKARAEGYKPKIELPKISKAETKVSKEKPKKGKKVQSKEETPRQEESSSSANFEDYFR